MIIPKYNLGMIELDNNHPFKLTDSKFIIDLYGSLFIQKCDFDYRKTPYDLCYSYQSEIDKDKICVNP